ncbi:protein E6 [Sesamum alatum]|uniref:Protein E6 n=1 Tax=Sesamum alatum TaxID=300844 RepID=A0AAE2CGC2_9LAMI|nr:protein E6 [Sesamum alatum]
MASSSTNHLSLLLLLLLSLFSSLHTHARDSQFFNKVSATAAVPNTAELPNNQQPEPNFLPENENVYGLYGHESGQLPPSATTTTAAYNTESEQPVHKYLPKNYNPVAYVTQPEDVTESTTFTEDKAFTSTNSDNNNNYYNGGDQNNYYNNQQEEEEDQPEFRNYPAATTHNRNYYYNGGSSFNSQPQGVSETRFRGGATSSIRRNNNFNNGGDANYARPQPQGMSDTRFLENGKYFYDVNTDKYSSSHPYETLKRGEARNEYNNRNYYGNSENAYEFSSRENSMGGYQEENDLP